MANALIKSVMALLVIVIVIITAEGIGNARQVPTMAPINPNIQNRGIHPFVETMPKSAPIEEAEPVPETHYWSISPLTLIPKNDSIPYDKVAGSLRDAAGAFYAPVHLPQGATITSLQAYVYDQDSTPATFIEIYLYRKPHSNANSEIMTYVHSQAVEESYGFEMIGTTNFVTGVDQVVNNQNYTYFIRATFDTTNPSPGMRLGSIVISYTE